MPSRKLCRIAVTSLLLEYVPHTFFEGVPLKFTSPYIVDCIIHKRSKQLTTMVYEIRASVDMICANCLFRAVGWKEWGRKKDTKRLFPTTPPA